MKKLLYMAALAAMTVLASCQKEETFALGSKNLGVKVSEAGAEEVSTKSAIDDGGVPYVFEVNGEELSLTQSVSNIPSGTGRVATKGKPVTEAGDAFDKFNLYIFNADDSKYTYSQVDGKSYDGSTVLVSFADEAWTLDKEVLWPESSSTPLQFYASNGGCLGSTTQNITETLPSSGGIKITYSDSGSDGSSAENEKDLLCAYTKLPQEEGIKREKEKDTAIGLTFHHALAGIKFNFGTITNNITLTNVTLSDVATSGECLYKDDVLSWTPGDEKNTLSQSYSTTTGDGVTVCDSEGTRTFFVIPQTISADAKMTFTLEYDVSAFSGELAKEDNYGSSDKMVKTVEVNFADVVGGVTSWDAGKLYTYTISGTLVFAELGKTMYGVAKALDIDRPDLSVKKVVFSTGEIPATKSTLVTGPEVQSSRSLTPIYASWDSDNGVITLHTTAKKIFLKPDSSNLFDNFQTLTQIEGMTCLDSRNVTTMYAMFRSCYKLQTLDLTSLDTRSVTNMSYMFHYCTSLQTLSIAKNKFVTDNVTDMSHMFDNCTKLQYVDLSGFHTSKVTNMASMFDGCQNIDNLDLSSFETSNVTNMRRMFCYCLKLSNVNLKGFHTGKVTDMSEMFWDTSSMTSLDLTSFDTSNVLNMREMFAISGIRTVNLSSFNTSKVTTMYWMFYGCKSLQSVDISSFKPCNVTTMSGMFESCSSLVSITLDKDKFDTSSVTDMSDMFYSCSKLASLDVSGFDTSNVTTMFRMFCSCGSLKTLDVSGFKTSNVTTMAMMFDGCSAVEELNVSGFNTSKVTSMSSMFERCAALTKLDVTKFDTQNVKNMSYMFYGCTKLAGLDVTKFNTANVTTMYYMFKDCKSLTTLDVTKFDTSSVTTMESMFDTCSGLTSIDVTKFNTVNVTTMRSMFYKCSGLTSLDVSKFDTSSVTSMGTMFSGCSGLTSMDLSALNVANVTNMYGMFQGCTNIAELNLGAKFTVASSYSSMLSEMGKSVTPAVKVTCTQDAQDKFRAVDSKNNVVSGMISDNVNWTWNIVS